ncbi:hypothetical protein [Clostridium mediterraneense]|uniref:hypothetical protein n=1 Tax=Clostridium mediterraneense TaxID=1805472 RepID=UPI0008366242|nr:hypothetical protein [Clostridium mediterraneense]
MNKTLKTILPISMSITVLLSSSIISNAAEVNKYNKDENVYINLQDNGEVKNIYVVNEFETGSAMNITDYGKYSSIKNLSTGEKIKVDGKKLSFKSDKKGKFYYQGDLESKQIPWNIKFTYYLNGEKVEPDSLLGKNGKLKIEASIKDNKDVDDKFFDNYILQMVITFDSEKCKNIKSEGAMTANVGSNKQLTYNILAGSEKEFSVETDITNFELDPITINAVPMKMSIDGIDTSEIGDKLSELTDGIDKISNGSSGLFNGSGDLLKGSKALLDGSGTLKSGAEKLQEGSKTLRGAMKTLNEASDKLNGGSKEMLKALGTVNSGLDNLDTLITSINTLASGSSDYASAMDNLVKSTAQMDQSIKGGLSNFGGTLSSITGNGSYIEAYNLAKNSLEGENAALANAYISLFDSINGATSAYSSNITSENSQINQALNSQYSAIQGLSSTYSQKINPAISQFSGFLSSLSELKNGLDLISKNYSTLDKSVENYTSAYGSILNGYEDVYKGISELSQGVVTINNGANILYNGTSALNDGAAKLKNGTDEMKNRTSGMDGEVEETVNNTLDKFKNEDFKADSFVAKENGEINEVQFVMKTKGITKKEEKKVEKKQEEKVGFFDKIKNLFK